MSEDSNASGIAVETSSTGTTSISGFVRLVESSPTPFGHASALYHMRQMAKTASPNCTLVLNEVKGLLHYVETLEGRAQDPESFRREEPSVSTNPLPALPLDYASAGTIIDRAMSHLDEGLPGGQRRRCETAYMLLQRGVQELGVWMRARGYHV